MDQQIHCNVEIKQFENGLFSVKVNGKEISQCITGFSLTEKAGECPVFTASMVTDTVKLSTFAIYDIPEPYKWVVESEIEDGLRQAGVCPPGSRLFFESISLPGAKVNFVHGYPGVVHVELLVDTDADADTLCQRYKDICDPKLPFNMDLIVTARKTSLKETDKPTPPLNYE